MRKPQVQRPDLPTAAPAPDAGGVAKPRKLLQIIGITAGLTLSAWGHAVGLGGINVVSALGQPLKAEIDLVAVSKADKPGLVARLASPDAYKGAGLDYPFGVKYSFEVVSRANGEPYLKISSNREINDPFVSLMVELSWASGKLMREYTFLLDPPGYVPAQPAAAAAEVVPAVSSRRLEPEAPEVAKLPEKAAEKPAEKLTEKHVARSGGKRSSRAGAADSVTVNAGDTLNKIAAQVKPDGVSLERMLVALYRANADQFDGKNMNRIKSGKILRVPDPDSIAQLSQAEAIQEIHAQSSDWNAYRQRLAGAATLSHRSDAPQKAVSGKISSSAADKTPVAPKSAKEVLRLSKGEAPGDKASGHGAQSNAAAEDAIARGKALSEEKARAALLESNLKDMKRLAELKAEAAQLAASAAAAKVEVASAVVVASSVEAASSVAASSAAAASSVAAASHVKAASHVRAASSVAAVPAEESLLDQLLGSPIALGIGAAALIGLGALGILFNRRRQAASTKEEASDAGTITGHLTSPVAPSPDTGDFTSAPAEAAPAGQIDPISEADLFLNFGREEQAEEVLRDALKNTPDNHQVHLKLLAIYANRQDAQSFAEVFGLLQATGDVEAIELAEVLARKLKPVAPVEEAGDATQFAPTLAESSFDEEPMSFDVPEPEEPIDFSEFETPAAAPEAPSLADAIDFDVTSTLPAQTASVDFDVTSSDAPLAAPLDMPLDMDITSAAPAEPDEFAAFPEPEEFASLPEADEFATLPEADEFASLPEPQDEAMPSLDDLIFDVTPAEAPAAPAEPQPEEDAGMEFKLDFPIDEVEEKPATPPPSVNLADISLDMDDIAAPAAPAAEPVKSERWHEVATKLDLARAYQEMGDEVGAREILDEVLNEGDDAQKQEAQLLINQLG